VWPAMLEAYSAAEGRLSARLLAALNAAEASGGDLRGRQSAAILVVPATGAPWDTVMSLRVEDHSDPLGELARLAKLDEAYRVAGEGDERLAEGRHDEAATLFARACELAPESDELRFWAGLGAAQVGDMDAALAHVRAAIEVHPGWLELLRRLTPEFAPSAPAVLAALDGHLQGY
jgi:tetratricopeptide (TPR) repeat protein